MLSARNSTNKQIYHTLCECQYNIPIFSRDWFLDATAGSDNWDVLLYIENDTVLASWTYYLPKKHITMPPLTQTMGIVFYDESIKCSSEKIFHKKREITEKLLVQLPDTKYFLQNFDSSFTDWLPFLWRGYNQRTHYTYKIDDLSDIDGLFLLVKDFIRKNVKKAENRYGLIFTEITDVDEYYRVLHKTFERQNIKYDGKDVITSVYDAAYKRNQGKLFAVRESSGAIHAVGFLVWQKSCAYYLSGGADPRLRSSGAQAFLLWNMIKFASTVSDTFDFEGSIIKGVEFFFSSFASRQTPYFCITRDERIVVPLVKACLNTARVAKGRVSRKFTGKNV